MVVVTRIIYYDLIIFLKIIHFAIFIILAHIKKNYHNQLLWKHKFTTNKKKIAYTFHILSVKIKN